MVPLSSNPSPHLSIVSTLFLSETTIHTFLAECRNALNLLECTDYEIILVNDGSPDLSSEVVQEFRAQDSRITLIELSRNFGHHYAAHAGLSYSRGEIIFLIDSDLEVSPNVLVSFYREIQTGEYAVVYGYQVNRKGGLFERLSGAAFWKLFNSLSEVKVPANLDTTRIMTRQYANELVALGDKNLFLAGMMHWVGFPQKGIPICKTTSKRTTYRFMLKLRLFANALTSFSAAPLVFIFYLGSFVTLMSLGLGTFLLVQKLVNPETLLPGWTSLVTLITFLSGFIILNLGIVGIYVAKIFAQVQGRPLYIIKNIYR